MDAPLLTARAAVVSRPEIAAGHDTAYASALWLALADCKSRGVKTDATGLPNAVCTVGVRFARVSTLVTITFVHPKPRGEPRVLCALDVNITSGEFLRDGVHCMVCGSSDPCPHIAYYCQALFDAETSRDTDSPVAIVSPLRPLFSALQPRRAPQQGIETDQLGLVLLTGRADPTGLPWLCVYPFAYHTGPHAVATATFRGSMRNLSLADKADLMILCGTEPYRPSPVISDLQEATLARVADHGTLWSDAVLGRFGDASNSYAGAPLAPAGDLDPDDLWRLDPARPAELGWTFRGSQQRLGIAWVPDHAHLMRCGERAYMVDAENRYLVPIDAPIGQVVAAHGFNLSLQQVDLLTPRDVTALASAKLPLPWRTDDAIPLDRARAVHDVLAVRPCNDGHVDAAGRPLLEGIVERTYDEVAFPFERSFILGDRMYGDVDGCLYSLPARTERSRVLAEKLEAGAASSFARVHQGRVLPVLSHGQSQRAAWLNMAGYLKRNGVTVSLGRDVNLAPDRAVPAGQVAARPVVEEIGERNLYALGVPVEINGKLVDLSETLAQIATDARFEAMVAGVAGKGGDWAIDLPDGSIVTLAAVEVQRLMAPLAEILRSAGGERPVLSALQAANLSDAFDVSRCNKIHHLKARITKLQSAPDLFGAPEPHGFKGTLRDYQKVGLAWLNRLAECEFGGILADDMGLGKTVQILAHLLWLKAGGHWDGLALVVCPSSLTWNWADEAAKFAPSLRVLLVKGGAAERAEQLAQADDYDLVITSYPQTLRDVESMKDLKVGELILDEAQQVKNARAKTAVALRSLQASRVVVVTGTPVENHLSDFFTLFDYALPGVLGTGKTFRSQYQTPIESRGDAELQAALVRMVSPFILRRPKSVVEHELPPKTEEVRMIELLPGQRRLYEQLRAALYGSVREYVREHGLGTAAVLVLEALTKLRQVCDDPRLVKLESAKAVRGSAKMEALLDLLGDAIADGHKVLVFSSFASMLHLISERLTHEGIGHTVLTGETRNRQDVVAAFQTGQVPVFLISLKAGGVGLNLTAADVVVHYDLWWNPAAEEQATDRAHRLGQDKPVTVYKFAVPATLDEHILAMQQRKANLARAILDAGEATRATFSADDIDALFGPR